jgi:LPS export ABC transporter protein LptC/lipopolysaccharide transport protein LptA
MAYATSFDRAASVDEASEPSRRGERLVVVGVDRSKEFRRARRHTLFVKLLRYLLPFLTILSIGIYAYSALKSSNFGSNLGLQIVSKILPENLTMDNPFYRGFTEDGGSYVVRARTAQPDLADTKRISLDHIEGTLTDAKNVTTDLTAARGLFDSGQSVLKLEGGIDITSQDGLKARLQSAVVDTKQNVIDSEEPVVVDLPNGQIRSNRLRIVQKENTIHFIEDVRTHLKPNSGRQNDDAQAGTQAQRSGQASAMLGASNKPIDIDSVRLTVDREGGLATFQGRVKARQEDQTLETEVLNVHFKEADTTDGDSAGNAGATGSSQIELITAPEPVILTRGAFEQVTGQSARFDAINQTAVISGNVVISSGADRRAVADVAQIDSKSDTILLTGRVVVNQGENQLRGERLFVDRTEAISRLSSPSNQPDKPGRIYARLKRQDPSGAGEGQTHANDKIAQASGKGSDARVSSIASSAFKGDPNAPVDVEANTLDVDDKRKEALFAGRVLVSQGPMTLTADHLTALYSGEAGLAGAGAATGATNARTGGTELNRIKAKGKVFVNSKAAGQNAKGDWADIDLKANTIVLGGDVVLNQGKNVIKATVLRIDLVTGNAVVETSEGEDTGGAWASRIEATPGANISQPLKILRGNRPSAVFYPSQMTNTKTNSGGGQPTEGTRAKQTTQRATRPSTTSSWEATTDRSSP